MSWHENKNKDKGGRGRGGNRRGGNYRGSYHGKLSNKRIQKQHFHGGKRMKFEVTHRLKEMDIGITEFMGDHEHFTGIFKERYGDFHVNEITVDGEIAKLTNQNIPVDVVSKIDPETLGDTAKKLLHNLEVLNNPDSNINSIELDVTDLSKEQRRVAHQIAKQSSSIKSQTIEKDNKKFMILSKHNKSSTDKNAQSYREDTREDWSQRNGLYCHFLMHKVNTDTMDALNQLALNLRLKPNMFSYAGTKDRRARTTQWVSVKRIDPKKILQAAIRVRGVFVGNFKYEKKPLKLGMLNGNRFIIALRNVTASDDEIEKAMTSLRDNGFINYYGLQRFGSVPAIPTHEIGKVLLQGKWNEAIDLILKPRVGDQRDMAEAREIFAKTKDPAAALKKINRLDKIEARLLKGIQLSGPTNPQGALDSIPRNTRLMYIHSYQSYVWNNVVSRRIREFGRHPVVGDLVYEKPLGTDDSETLDYLHTNDGEDGQEKNSEPTVTVSKNLDTDERMEDAEEVSKINKENSAKNVEKKENGGEVDLSPLPAVKILTQEDLKNYSLADVVMPQPGWRITYPTYAKAWYEELFTKDELNIDLKQKDKKYSLGGAYRKILQVPENLTWRVMNYKEINDELIRSDIDELKNSEGPKNNPDGKYKALILEMSLKPSTYATMALREILKHDTSAQTQAAQSAAHHAQDKAQNEEIDDVELEKNDITIDEVEEVSEEVENKIEIADEKKEIELPMETEPIETEINTKNEITE